MPRHNVPITDERMKEVALALLRTCPQMLSACPRAMYKRTAEKYGISIDELGEFTMSLFLNALDEIAAEAKELMEHVEPPEFAEAHGVSFKEMKACVKAAVRQARLSHYSMD